MVSQVIQLVELSEDIQEVHSRSPLPELIRVISFSSSGVIRKYFFLW